MRAPLRVVVSWSSNSTRLWYAQQIEGRRLDVEIVDDRTRLDRNMGAVTDVIEANVATRPVYVIRAVSAERERIRERFVLTRLDAVVASNVLRVSAEPVGPRP